MQRKLHRRGERRAVERGLGQEAGAQAMRRRVILGQAGEARAGSAGWSGSHRATAAGAGGGRISRSGGRGAPSRSARPRSSPSRRGRRGPSAAGAALRPSRGLGLQQADPRAGPSRRNRRCRYPRGKALAISLRRRPPEAKPSIRIARSRSPRRLSSQVASSSSSTSRVSGRGDFGTPRPGRGAARLHPRLGDQRGGKGRGQVLHPVEGPPGGDTAVERRGRRAGEGAAQARAIRLCAAT